MAQPEPLRLIKVHGSPYQRGLQHGRACGDLIRRYPDVLLAVLRAEAQWRALDTAGPFPTRDDLVARAMRFLPSLEAFAPHLVEEVRGIADGARLPFAEVLLVNVRAEIMGLTTADAHCTAFAVGRSATADGSVLSGQNLDQDPLNRDLMIMLHVEPDEGPAMLMCSFAGLVGYPGINEAGISVFQNALSTKAWRSDAMPHYFMKRVLLEQADVAACAAVAGNARLCSSGNYVLTDRRGALRDIEVTPDRLATVEAEDDILVHANHFHSPALARRGLAAQHPRFGAARAANGGAARGRRGRITLDDLKACLSDHEGAPAAICRHQPNIRTIAAIIAEPDHGRLHVAAGVACETAFVTYSL